MLPFRTTGRAGREPPDDTNPMACETQKMFNKPQHLLWPQPSRSAFHQNWNPFLVQMEKFHRYEIPRLNSWTDALVDCVCTCLVLSPPPSENLTVPVGTSLWHVTPPSLGRVSSRQGPAWGGAGGKALGPGWGNPCSLARLQGVQRGCHATSGSQLVRGSPGNALVPLPARASHLVPACPASREVRLRIQQKGTRPRESRGLFTEGKFPTLGILTLMHILTHLLLTPMPLAIRKELLWPTASRTLGHFSFPSRDQEPPLALLEFSLLQAMGFMSSGGSVLGIRPESKEHFPFAARAMSCWGSWGQSRRVVPGAGLGRAAPVHTTRGSLAAENSNTMT